MDPTGDPATGAPDGPHGRLGGVLDGTDLCAVSEPPGEVAVQAEGLRRSFDTGVALEGLTLQVGRGEVLALLGPNGAGKTTTVRLLNGVLAPEAGWCRVAGLDPATEADEVRRRTGVLTENAGLDDRLSARENLVFTARMRGFVPRAARARVDELLERFGLAERADAPVQGASTGQRKRLALIRALIHDPEVLFLDEPTSGLDPAATRSVIELIGSLAADHGRTVVLCTHFLGEAGRLADRMAVLDHGRLMAFGRPGDLAARLWHGIGVDVDFGRPADATDLALLGSRPNASDIVPTATGATLRVDGRDDVPLLVRDLTESGRAVFGVTPRPVTLEDVYFAIEGRIGAIRTATGSEVTP